MYMLIFLHGKEEACLCRTAEDSSAVAGANYDAGHSKNELVQKMQQFRLTVLLAL